MLTRYASTFVRASLIATVLTIVTLLPLTATADHHPRLGGYDVVTIGGVDVLKDPASGIISYYNSATGVHTCSTGWNSIKDNSFVGGVTVDFEKAGFYEFEYMLEPWTGKFAHLEGAQILLIKDLDLDRENQIDTDKVLRLSYSYDSDQKLLFNIPEPGTYTIGFGPYDGTLLPKSIVEKTGHPNSASIRFRLSRFADEKTLEDAGYQFGKFVDLSIYKPEAATKYMISPVVKGYDFIAKNLDPNYAAAINEVPGLDTDRVEWILEEYVRANQAGYSNVHPFGKDLGYAEKQLTELRSALTAGDYEWNDIKIKEMTAAKAGPLPLALREQEQRIIEIH